jgi:hypothetical protein
MESVSVKTNEEGILKEAQGKLEAVRKKKGIKENSWFRGYSKDVQLGKK